jgi:hypothetical protein
MTFIILGETCFEVSSNLPAELVTPEKGITYNFGHDDQINYNFLNWVLSHSMKILLAYFSYLCSGYLLLPGLHACITSLKV